MKMQNPLVRQLVTIFLLLMYVNRGFFISSADEINNNEGELNSVLELIVEVITGESNDIDEDGDSQTECNFVKIIPQDFSQQLAQSLELMNLFSKEIITTFPSKVELLINNFYSRIEKPPES